MPTRTTNCRAAFSMVEVVISTLLVGLVVVGAMATLGAAVRTQTTASEQLDGPVLAEMLLAEIMSAPYEDPEEGPTGSKGRNSGESNASRQDFDDVDDYHGWVGDPPQQRDGTPLASAAGWTRSVEVNWAEQINGNGWLWDTGLKRVEVTATAPDGAQTKRFGYRYRTGQLEQPPSTDQLTVTEFSSSVTLHAGGTPIEQATNLLNHVESPHE